MTALLKSKGLLNFFPVPEYLLFYNCAIAVADTAVRFVEFKRSFFKESFKLMHYEKVALPQDTIQAGFINKPEELTRALRELRQKHGLRYVYATLPEERAYLFSAIIEKVPTADLRDAVAFIIEENVPITLADAVFDFNVVGEMKETNKLKVTVSVLSRKVVDFYVQVFEAAGLIPVSFDIESQAISRAIIKRGDKRTHLITNLGEKKTGFYIVENEVVQFTTTLPYGTAGGSSHMNDLHSEMRKIFAFWDARPEGSGKIERILFCGPGALDADFTRELVKEIQVEHLVADPWINLQPECNTPTTNVSQEAMEYVPAAGLVLPRAIRHYV